MTIEQAKSYEQMQDLGYVYDWIEDDYTIVLSRYHGTIEGRQRIEQISIDLDGKISQYNNQYS